MRDYSVTIQRSRWIAFILGLLVPIACSGAGGGSAGPAKSTRSFSRIDVVGVSVSAGFGGGVLADAMKAAAPGAEVTGAASVFMFRDAVGDGARQVDQVLAARPDLVLAIDFLFWHVYNSRGPDRLARLERGLAD